jgi:hypothetical protein
LKVAVLLRHLSRICHLQPNGADGFGGGNCGLAGLFALFIRV